MNELQHHGILGQKWGVRRYQNVDGSYTQAGVARYKAAKKSGDRVEIKAAKQNLKESVKYDEGEEKYASGTRMNEGDMVKRAALAIGAASASVLGKELSQGQNFVSGKSATSVMNSVLNTAKGMSTQGKAAAIVLAASGVTLAAIGIKQSDDRQALSRYYAGTTGEMSSTKKAYKKGKYN